MTANWISDEGEGAILRLRVTPKASVDAVEGVETGADGLAHLKIRVRAVPDKGAANAAVLKLLAKALGVPKSALELVSGQTSRVKMVRIAGLSGGEVGKRLGLMP
ncbi:MAG TPA: hypothetical protein DF715_16690 [Oceanicaulis sp.]|uniref:UPF0235 protein GCM10007420_18700 n=1 Tax=Glycocaulis albus TaxID=1382801 RepID=A0ABQ1XTT2_9PROT|nr:DUF167 family protein [Glycocaulis albus]MBV5258778.1 DUF167 domain-containing protein [Synechococcus moorigangaii CMS01]GGH02672.1 UPF0235 protein [Glycocaulis albus]HCY57068.1 hypothetical protein [Oceanicaulis sp.]